MLTKLEYIVVVDAEYTRDIQICKDIIDPDRIAEDSDDPELYMMGRNWDDFTGDVVLGTQRALSADEAITIAVASYEYPKEALKAYPLLPDGFGIHPITNGNTFSNDESHPAKRRSLIDTSTRKE